MRAKCVKAIGVSVKHQPHRYHVLGNKLVINKLTIRADLVFKCLRRVDEFCSLFCSQGPLRSFHKLALSLATVSRPLG